MSEDAKTGNPVPGVEPIEQAESEHVEDFEHPAAAPETPPEPAQPSAPPQPAAPEPDNRRTTARYSVHWRAALVGDNAKYLGRTDNVSLSGVAIISDINLRPNQVFQVYLEIPVKLGKPPVIFQALGVVVHSMLSQEAFKIGLRFRSFEGDSENVLRKALAANAARELFDPYAY
jgi:hypothetical protein